jgi:ferrous iron transport protein B
MTLADISIGEEAIIVKVKGRGAFRKRILEMGFVAGQNITAVKKSPLNDPIEYKIMGYHLTLRNSEAKLIEVISVEESLKLQPKECKGTKETFLENKYRQKRKHIHIALVGNPNSGKTTIFNELCKTHEHVGNYSGVTVDAKQGEFHFRKHKITITDLPGTYSLTSYSPEEVYVRDFIYDKMPDVIVNIIDGSNLERNLNLTTQLIDMDMRLVGVVNMYDEIIRRGDKFNHNTLGKMIGIPLVPSIGSRKRGVREMLEKIIEVYNDESDIVRHVHINYSNTIEDSIIRIQDKIKEEEDNSPFLTKTSPRFISVKLLENDREIKKKLHDCKQNGIIKTAENQRKNIKNTIGEEAEDIITDSRFGFISGALKETFKASNKKEKKKSNTSKIDKVLTHRFWGIPFFIAFLWLMFFTTFRLGNYPMEWLQSLIDWISTAVNNNMANGMFKDMLINGIIGGVGGVLVFIPNIMLLFMFISFMEDTGYMARAVFIMDRVMHKIGLHGKSFIPLLIGFGCNVPAVMGTRIIESKRDRLLTMLLIPFMSCSAKLPVYIIFISAFFPNNPVSMIFLLYFLGIFVGFTTSIILKKTLFRNKEIPFVMELPPYRMPTVRSVFHHMWFRVAVYLKKIGSVILLASVIIWVLSYFPKTTNYSADYQAKIEKIESNYQENIGEETNNFLLAEKEKKITRVQLEKQAEEQENSYIGIIGKFIAPVMKPLGFNWKMTVAIITGISAKEIVISTLGVLYTTNIHEDEQAIVSKIRKEGLHPDKKDTDTNSLSALAFMVFILIYFPCIGTLAAIRKESGSWKWAAFSILYTTAIAWIAAFAVFQLGQFFI